MSASNPRGDAAARRRAWALIALLSITALGAASWYASLPDGWPARLAPVMSLADRVLSLLVALATGIYAFAFAREALSAARTRHWPRCAWLAIAATIQLLLAILALSFAFPATA